MLDFAKKREKEMILVTIATLVLGLILAISPDLSLRLITIIISIGFIGVGVYQIFNYLRKPQEEKMFSAALLFGIFMLAVGIFFFVRNDALVNFITILIGIVLCVKSLFKIQFAINVRKMAGNWYYNLFTGMISLALGVLLLFNPFGSAVTFMRIVGILIVIGAILEIIETSMVIKTLDLFKEETTNLEVVEKNKKDKKKVKEEAKELEAHPKREE